MQITVRLTALSIVLIMLGACAGGGAPSPRRTGEAKSRHTCDFCHEPDKPASIATLRAREDEVGSLCLMCHDYGTNHHPYAFTPSKNSHVNPEKGYPLFEGRVECLTCHDPHARAGFAETPMLLRGGPYPDRWAICFRCHIKESYASINPHLMLDDKGAVRTIEEKPVCLFCHAVMPDPKTDRAESIYLRADVGFLCWRCHAGQMAGELFSHHFLRKVRRNTTQLMKAAEQKHDVILPVQPRNRLTCSTCHNPHQKGVVLNAAAAKGADAKHRLRLRRHDLCMACHPNA
jgi:predicted CXXCH cytochrome family protein